MTWVGSPEFRRIRHPVSDAIRNRTRSSEQRRLHIATLDLALWVVRNESAHRGHPPAAQLCNRRHVCPDELLGIPAHLVHHLVERCFDPLFDDGDLVIGRSIPSGRGHPSNQRAGVFVCQTRADERSTASLASNSSATNPALVVPPPAAPDCSGSSWRPATPARRIPRVFV